VTTTVRPTVAFATVVVVVIAIIIIVVVVVVIVSTAMILFRVGDGACESCGMRVHRDKGCEGGRHHETEKQN
jgi:uncharacterized membrane protein YdbT with pleckstrin-like domain